MRQGGERAEARLECAGLAAGSRQPELLQRHPSPGGRLRLPSRRRPMQAPVPEAEQHRAARAAAAGASGGVCAPR